MENAQSPEEVPQLFIKHWNNRRADLLAELFELDADFINVVGLWWDKREEIFKAHDYGLRKIFSDSTLRAGKMKIKRLSEGAAIVHVRMILSGQTPIGDYAGVRRTIFTFVVRKHHDLWLCASAQNTDIVAGAETFIRAEDGSLKPVDYRN